jgi:hypothetical protein
MPDYHSNDNTWDRRDPPDPHEQRCTKCGGQGGRHDDRCSTSPTLEQVLHGVDVDALNAALDLVGRTGAHQLDIGYLNDDVPIDQADWYATATWRGAKLIVEHRTGPVEAAEALARKLINGATCTHCSRVMSLSGDRAGVCRWTRHGDKWVRGCSDTHPEGARNTELVRDFTDRYGKR